MKIDNNCPLCNNPDCTSHWASVSRFLRERMFEGRAPKGCRFQHCERCGFYFFNIRPDDAEMQRLYQDYRGEHYQCQREKYDSGYTKEFNDSLGSHPTEVANRITILEDVLTATGTPCDVDVLDFGGNEGKLIPQSLTGVKYCYDLSGNPTVSGVTMLLQDQLPQHRYGLIMLQHVLEHVSYPVQFLKDNIVGLMDDDTKLYIELPYELEPLPSLLAMNRKPFYVFKNRFKLYRPEWFLPTLPFTSGPEFHEHLNGFSLKSIPPLLSAAGLECLHSDLIDLDSGYCKTKIICCLARKLAVQVSS